MSGGTSAAVPAKLKDGNPLPIRFDVVNAQNVERYVHTIIILSNNIASGNNDRLFRKYRISASSWWIVVRTCFLSGSLRLRVMAL